MAEPATVKPEETPIETTAEKILANDPPAPLTVSKAKVYRAFGREKPVHHVMGAGKPADILLWRNKKLSGRVLGGATALWVFFELLEYHLITLVCYALILLLTGPYLSSVVSKFMNKSPLQIPDVKLEEKCVLEVATAVRIETNRAIAVLRNIASGRDLKQFLSVIGGLWVLSVVGNWFNFLTLIFMCVLLMFTVPVTYEKYEDQIDPILEKAEAELKKQYKEFDAKVLSKIPRGLVKEKKKE